MYRPYRHIAPLLLLLLFSIGVFAQPYGNEWIDYSKTYFRVEVTQDGIYRVPYSLIDAQPGVDLPSIDPNTYQLFVNGAEVPIHLNSSGIEFYGKRNDGSFDTQLYENPDFQPNENYSLFSDTTVYFLTWGGAPPSVSRYATAANNLTNLPPKEDYCKIKIRVDYVNTHREGKRYYLGDPLYKSIFDEGEGFTGLDIINASNFNINTPNKFAGVPTVNFKFSYLTISNNPHDNRVSWNGSQIWDTSFYQLNNNYKLFKKNFSLPTSQVNSGNNTITFTAAGSGGVDRIAVAYLETEYASQLNFNGKSKQLFTLPDNNATRYLEITNFNDKGTNPILYDLTNNIRIVGTSGNGPHQFKLAPLPGERELYITSQDASDIIEINRLERRVFTNYLNPNNQGDYIIVSDPRLYDDGTGTNWVQKYADYRSSSQGGNFKATVVDINQLYDQFAYGIRKHPLSMRNFFMFALDRWPEDPRYVFLIGKGREYHEGRNDQFVNKFEDYIPPFGHPGSINLLTAKPGSLIPEIPIGRLSVFLDPFGGGGTIHDIGALERYYNKVVDMEAEKAKTGDPYQTIEEKLWMKELIHLGGGTNQTETQNFKTYLLNYETIIEDMHYGGNVTSFFKNSSAPIQIAQSQYLRELIDNGVSLITFFGHSSANSFDLSLDDPANYDNYKKYPVILSNGCFTGNIYNREPGISEDFVLEEDRGAIGFIATTSLSHSLGLNEFSTNFYKNLSITNYTTTTGVGDIIKGAISDIETGAGGMNNIGPLTQIVLEEITLHGDPAFVLNTHARPDYALEKPLVWFEPANPTIEDETFDMKVVVTNLGMAIDTNINLFVKRTLPDGTIDEEVLRVKGTAYQDTFTVTFTSGGSQAFGLNEFYIHIDYNDEVLSELSENNNIIPNLQKNISSSDIYPIYPYEFSIVYEQGVTLKASTANPFADTNTYVIEIDTTELFNSPVKQSTTVTQSGGVVRWKPNITYTNDVVYYWRVGPDTSVNNNALSYRYSSFIFIDGSSPGWNQSHYYQYLKDDFDNLYVDSNTRKFEFIDDLREVRVRNGYWDQIFPPSCIDCGLPDNQIEYFLNGVSKKRWNCGGSGAFNAIVIAVFDPVTGKPWVAKYADRTSDLQLGNGVQINSVYKCVHCEDRDIEGFPYPTTGGSTTVWNQRVVDLLQSVPNGHYILAYSVNIGNMQNWSSGLINEFISLGSTLAQNPVFIGNQPAWAFFAQKGNPSTAEEAIRNDPNEVLDTTFTFSTNWNTGTLESPLIGPAYSWGSFHWRWHDDDPQPAADQTAIDIIGVKKDGTEDVLFASVTALDLFINTINANIYPFIKLRYVCTDDTYRTPTQLDYWRVIYSKVPEAALNPSVHFEFHGNEINAGETLTMTVAVENVTEIDMDSLLIKYDILKLNGQPIEVFQRNDSLKAYQTMLATVQFPTICQGANVNCLRELNSLTIEVNPDDDQPEQFHFNNIGILDFKVQGDVENPLLDVTFDGTHILDGDLVSAEPEILIKLKDENKYLALDDTSLINVSLVDPNGIRKRINFSSIEMEFYPALQSQLSKKNEAEIILRHVFEESGTYELLVQANDKSLNISGDFNNPSDGVDYKISFEIVKEATITNVLNYPNPFTTSTRFVFTLTGSQPPSYFKIQIMTISGKVVRELTQAELGQIRVGQNITEFAWDGTDQYGDPLANGLYLYRVVASIDGKPIEHRATGADRFFEKGFGKMYLAR